MLIENERGEEADDNSWEGQAQYLRRMFEERLAANSKKISDAVRKQAKRQREMQRKLNSIEGLVLSLAESQNERLDKLLARAGAGDNELDSKTFIKPMVSRNFSRGAAFLGQTARRRF